ncbi:hypothetical protein O1611_g7659 [Lasiodiplodia mahajangana]|uniref:Uncharacterized protein n=1 Tax=Lasiodiplodia mahajangana TaxID=1108764 RepID=A0ACC2JEV4_9PEZI|nr:hypothetical protein O1611_g7659 [Lasiodiplodia mahajangana]
MTKGVSARYLHIAAKTYQRGAPRKDIGRFCTAQGILQTDRKGRLCDRCEQILTAAWQFEVTSQCKGSFGSLEDWQIRVDASACQLCTLLWNYRTHEDNNKENDGKIELFYTINRPISLSTDSHRNIYIRPSADKPLPTSEVGVQKLRIDEEHFACASVSQADQITWSPAIISQIKLWLRSCLEKHEACPDRLGGGPPLRLIDVNPGGHVLETPRTPDEILALSVHEFPSIKLVATTALSQAVDYVMLSHCWGPGPGLMLTSDAESCFQNCVPPTLLQYIWIDAICINQSNSNEKARKIARMHHIYSQAVVNLSATSASNGSQGMIFERDLRKTAPLILSASLHVVSDIFSRKMLVYPNRWFREVVHGAVNTRGWVYQERILASRVIHFCRDQITWECRELQASEFHPAQHPFIPPDGRGTKTSHYAILGRDGTPQLKTTNLRELDGVWHRLCEQYSSTELTYPTDRLLAISAVARSICNVSSLVPDDYAGGLWKTNLPEDLKWRVCQRRRSPKIDAYCAPSWSWAATHANVIWDIEFAVSQTRSLVEIMAVSVKTIGDDPFSQNPKKQIIRVRWDNDIDEDGAHPAEQVYYILPLTQRLHRDDTLIKLDASVLRKAALAGQYYRVGFLENTRTVSEAAEDLEKWIPNYCKLAADEYCLELDHGRYVIEII